MFWFESFAYCFQSLACKLNNAWPCRVKSFYMHVQHARMMLVKSLYVFARLISHWNKLLYDFFSLCIHRAGFTKIP